MALRKKHSGVLLALGSGAARGWAHIGVLRAIEDAGLQVEGIAGSSMGALVGAGYAAGKLDLLHRVALDLDWKRSIYYFLEMNLPRAGLIDGGKVLRFVKSYVASGRIEDMALPYAAVATDIQTGREVVIDRGDVLNAVRASIAIPGIFTPVRRDDALLVDGGVANPVPASVARRLGRAPVVAVDLNHGLLAPRARRPPHAPEPAAGAGEAESRADMVIRAINQKIKVADWTLLKRWTARRTLPNLFEILGMANRIREAQIADLLLKTSPPDILIRPALGHFNFMDFHRAAEAIDIGYAAGRQALKAL